MEPFSEIIYSNAKYQSAAILVQFWLTTDGRRGPPQEGSIEAVHCAVFSVQCALCTMNRWEEGSIEGQELALGPAGNQAGSKR